MPDRATIDWFQSQFDVSRETIDKLRELELLTRKWNRSINLISPSTEDEIWTRHIADSAQLVRFAAKTTRTWVDLGSGGGFPALVVAVLAKNYFEDLQVTMIESDSRKCAFLRRALSALDLRGSVLNERIEQARPQLAQIVSARALTGLDGLLALAERHGSVGGKCLLMKGKNFERELTEAQKNWHIEVDITPSLTDNEAAILEIRSFKRANPVE